MVVEWYKMVTYASNCQYAVGGARGSAKMLPLRIALRRYFFKQNAASLPASASLLYTPFTWMLFIVTGRKWPKLSGPSRTVSFTLNTPWVTTPPTTVPTPVTKKVVSMIISRGNARATRQSFRIGSKLRNLSTLSIPYPVTLLTSKIGVMRSCWRFLAAIMSYSVRRTG